MSKKHDYTKCCLYCSHSMSCDDIYGGQMLICSLKENEYDGGPIEVDEDSCCDDYD